MNASRKSAGVRKAAAWEDRHANDARGSLADNASGLPDRSAALPEGSPGETPMLHAEGYQRSADATHPVFPAQAGDRSDDAGAAGQGAQGADDEAVKRRAHELWERENRPEGEHERHWEQAERELRGERG